MFETTGGLELPPEDLTRCMLPDSHPYVTEGLARRQEENQKDKSMQDSAWVSDGARLLQKSNMRWSECVAPAEQCESPWFALMPEREKFALAYTLKHTPGARLIDTSQSAGRCPTTEGAQAFAFLPRSKPWHMERRRPVLGFEMLLCHGMPVEVLTQPAVGDQGFSDPFLRDLAGNSVVAEAFAAVLIGTLTHWPHEQADAAEAASPSADSSASDSEEKAAEEICSILNISCPAAPGNLKQPHWW